MQQLFILMEIRMRCDPFSTSLLFFLQDHAIINQVAESI